MGTDGAIASSQEVQASCLDCIVLLFMKGGSTSTKAGGSAMTGGGLASSSLLSSLSSLNIVTVTVTRKRA